MKFFYSDHFLTQIKERRISKKVAKSILLRPVMNYFDTSTRHSVAVGKRKHLGKTRTIMVAYDDIIVGEIWFVTAYPLKDKEIENRVKSGRWVLKNAKN